MLNGSGNAICEVHFDAPFEGLLTEIEKDGDTGASDDHEDHPGVDEGESGNGCNSQAARRCKGQAKDSGGNQSSGYWLDQSGLLGFLPWGLGGWLFR
jgi:hypothetical protein